jgi:hypothetical protein
MVYTKEDLDEYRAYLKNLSEKDSSDIFFNSGSEHAAILMSTLFNRTKNNIHMFCEGLNPNGLTNNDEYFNAFTGYIERGGKLSLMVETQAYRENSRMFKYLIKKLEEGSENIIIKQIREGDKPCLTESLGNTEHCNFAVFDTNTVRLEYRPENYLAFGSFFYPEMANRLKSVFTEFFERATPVD